MNQVAAQDLLYGAIKGMVGALDDPYSSFFDPRDAKKFEQDLSGSFGGIGAEIGMRKNQLLIVAPLKGNPAEAAGLKAGDKILKVDDTFTANLTVDEAVKIIRGPEGSVVTLLILREGWDDAREFKITRQTVVLPTLDIEMKDSGIAYVRLYNFNGNVPPVFDREAIKLLLRGVKGMVLDLRNNPGGFLDVATYLAGWFLERGREVVVEQFPGNDRRPMYADGNAAFARLPMVVLVNSGSASASEILAGALRDDRLIKLVGEKTYGKGSVQEVNSLRDGSTVKVSIAKWLTPGGAEIDKKGLEPDIEVKLTAEDIEGKRDPQFDRALEVLRAEMQ